MKVHVPFKLEPNTLAALDKRARELGKTRSAYLRELVEKDLKPHGSKLKAAAEAALWCVEEMRAQHRKIILEGQATDSDWVTKRCDKIEKELRSALKKT